MNVNVASLSAETRSRIVALREQGMKIRDIGLEIGVSHMTVSRVCRNAGLTRYYPRPDAWSDEEIQAVIDGRRKGLNFSELLGLVPNRTPNALEHKLGMLREQGLIEKRERQPPKRNTTAVTAPDGVKPIRFAADTEAAFAAAMGKRRHTDFALRPSTVPAARIPAWLPGVSTGASSLVGGGSLSGAGARSARGV